MSLGKFYVIQGLGEELAVSSKLKVYEYIKNVKGSLIGYNGKTRVCAFHTNGNRYYKSYFVGSYSYFTKIIDNYDFLELEFKFDKGELLIKKYIVK